MGRAFVHIGVSRSGTTTLQRNVFERLEGVHYLGKFGKFHKSYPIAARWCEANTTLLERAKESIVRGTICPREDVQRLRASLEKLKARNIPVIYSNESLAQNKHIPFAKIATGINDVFGESELFITVRDPQTAIPSQYLWEIAQISETRRPFSKWLDDAIANPRRIGRIGESLEHYRYASMLRELQSVFHGRITILKYEDMIANSADFARSLGQLLGIESEAITCLLRLPAQNATRSGTWYSYRRVAHKFRSAAAYFGVRPFPLARKLDAMIETGLRRLPKKQIDLSDFDRARIAHFFPYTLGEQASRLITAEEAIRLQR